MTLDLAVENAMRIWPCESSRAAFIAISGGCLSDIPGLNPSSAFQSLDAAVAQRESAY